MSRTPTAASGADPGPVAHRTSTHWAMAGCSARSRAAPSPMSWPWLSSTPLTWRKNITHVAIDMSATYRAAIRTGLPDATVVVDHFHVVQLANKMLSTLRSRATAEARGRGGRASDSERKARRLLRNREDLTDEQFATMWNPLLDGGRSGRRC